MAVLTNWEVRNEDNQLSEINGLENLIFSGTILGKPFRFSNTEIKYGDSFVIYEKEKIKLGRKSKLYNAFLRDDALIVRDWSIFIYDGDMYLEGFTYQGNRVGFCIQDSVGPYLYARSGEKILIDLGLEERRQEINQDFFPIGRAPDLFD